MPFSRGSSWPKDQTLISCVFCIGRQILLPLSHLGSSLVVMSESKVSRTTSPCMDFSAKPGSTKQSRGVSESRVQQLHPHGKLSLLAWLPVFPLVYISSYVVVQSLSYAPLFVTPWTAAHQASRSFTISPSLLKLMTIESVMPSNQLMLCHPLLLSSIFPSITVFSNELALHIRWPK